MSGGFKIVCFFLIHSDRFPMINGYDRDRLIREWANTFKTNQQEAYKAFRGQWYD